MPKLKAPLPWASFTVNVEKESCAVGEELLCHALRVPGFAGKKENSATHLSTSLSPQSYVNETKSTYFYTSDKDLCCTVARSL